MNLRRPIDLYHWNTPSLLSAHCRDTHIHPCLGGARVRPRPAKTERNVPFSQPHPRTFLTRSQLWPQPRKDREIHLFLPIWMLGDMVGTKFCRQQGGCGMEKRKQTAVAWAPSSEKQHDQRFPRGDTQHIQSTEVSQDVLHPCADLRPPAWGLVTLKDWLGSVLFFLEIHQEDQCTSAINQTTNKNTWWGGMLTTNCTESMWQNQ